MIELFAIIGIGTVIYFIHKIYSEQKQAKFEQADAAEGIEKKYYKNGNIEKEIGWKHSEIKYLHGIQRTYFPNSKLKTEASCNRGVYLGDVKSYYINGNIFSIHNYSHGMSGNYSYPDGEGKYYSSEGKLALTVNYSLGLVDPDSVKIITDVGAVIWANGISGENVPLMTKETLTLSMMDSTTESNNEEELLSDAMNMVSYYSDNNPDNKGYANT